MGAPIYAKPNQPDIGRIVIFYNNKVMKTVSAILAMYLVPKIIILVFFKGQGLIKNASIAGQVTFGHFGHSITNLGDLNNDGCDGNIYTHIICYMYTYCTTDIAVSAPFDEGGKVFTYFGCNDSSTIINTTQQQVKKMCFTIKNAYDYYCHLQVITAEQMVSQVSNLTSLEGFGFSLDGKVDVDGNGYRGY